MRPNKLNFLILTAFLLLSMMSPNAQGTDLIRWDMAGDNALAVHNATFTETGISGNGLSGTTNMSGFDLATATVRRGIISSRVGVRTLEQSISNDEYISFYIKPEPGYRMSITQIEVSPVYQNGARTFALCADTTGFATDKVLAEFTTSGSLNQGVIETDNYFFTLSPALENITDSIEFRIYNYGTLDQTFGNQGIGSWKSPENTRDLVIIGSVELMAPTLNSIESPDPVLSDAGTQSVNLSGITDGFDGNQTITVEAESSDPLVVNNLNITYTSPEETALLQYDLAGPGQATITVTVSATNVANTTQRTFDVEVLNAALNNPPQFNGVFSNILALSTADPIVIEVTGIDDGDDNKTQALTLGAVSSDITIVPNPQVSYTSPDPTGTITINPQGISGLTTITVFVKDDGGTAEGSIDSVGIQFTVDLRANFDDVSWADDFEDGIHNWWDNGQYGIIEEDGILKVAGKKKKTWTSFGTNLPNPVDISENKVLSVDIRTGELRSPFTITAYIKDDANNANITKRVTPSENFNTFSFEFTDTDIDYTQISAVFFAINGENLTWDGEAWLDNISLGLNAKKLGSLSPVSNKQYYKNTGSKQILLTDISNVADLSLEGGSGLIENVQFTAITNGFSTLTFDLINNAVGKDTLYLVAQGVTGYQDNEIPFEIEINDNFAPEFDPVNDLKVEINSDVEIELTGISDGDGAIEQSLSISATSENESITGSISVDYTNGLTKGTLSFTPVATGENVLVTVTIDDGEATNNQTQQTFLVSVYNELNNAPSMLPIPKQDIIFSAGMHSVQLLEIEDGEDGTQNISISATSSNQAVIPDENILVVYESGFQGSLNLNPVTTGLSTITVTLTDDGGNGTNNGNNSATYTFNVEVLDKPLNGYAFEFTDVESDADMWNLSSEYTLSYTDFNGFSNIARLDFVNKGNWDAVALDMPGELDLTEYPFISLDFYSVNKPIFFHVYFFDITHLTAEKPGRTSRNTNAAHEQRVEIPANTWVHLTFDYSGENMLQNSDGEDILINRTDYILMNMHENNFPFPQTEMNGTVYIKNVKVGDKAELGEEEIIATIDPVSNQAYLYETTPTEKHVLLSGISDGNDSRNVSIKVEVADASVVTDVSVGEINIKKNAILTLTPGVMGSTSVDVIIQPDNKDYLNDTVTFTVSVLDSEVTNTSEVTVELSETHQVWRGIGSMLPSINQAEEWSKIMGGTAFRLGMLGGDNENSFEMVNDNDDPNVMNLSAFNRSIHNWDAIRLLIANGAETFYVTWWSPEDWMKDNLSVDMGGPGAQGNTENTTNRLSFYMYEEFAEHVAAFCKIFYEETGLHLTAIGLQNEPAFQEPYGSAILDPTYFVQLTKVVGDRLVAEGIPTRFGSPEQVITQNLNSMTDYIAAFKADTKADEYTLYAATHGYDKDGVGQANISGTLWNSIRSAAHSGANPKEVWLTETGVETTSWSHAIDIATGMYDAIVNGDITTWMSFSPTGQLFESTGERTNSFQIYRHFGRFIRPGALRVETTESENNLFTTTFLNNPENGSGIATVLINNSTTPKTVKLTFNGGASPDLLDVYTSQASSYFNKTAEGIVPGAVIVIPGKSITTVSGYMSSAVTPVTVSNGTGSGNYPVNSVVEIIANDPAIGQAFYRWTGDVEYLGNRYTANTELVVPVSGTVNVSAEYISLPTHVLTVVGGSQSGNGQYLIGEEVSITANDSSLVNLVFAGWSGDISYVTDIYSETTTLIMPGKDIKVTAIYKPVTSTNDVLSDNSISVYPNPVTKGELYINTKESGLLTIISLNGIVYKQETIYEGLNNIDVSDMKKGIYMLRLNTYDKILHSKVIIR